MHHMLCPRTAPVCRRTRQMAYCCFKYIEKVAVEPNEKWKRTARSGDSLACWCFNIISQKTRVIEMLKNYDKPQGKAKTRLSLVLPGGDA
jgi:hypothetical protein